MNQYSNDFDIRTNSYFSNLHANNNINFSSINSVNENLNYPYQNNFTFPSPYNVKIMGLNVCGIRSKLINNIFEDFVREQGIEILCLSETKTDHIDLTDTKFNGEYTCFTKEKTKSTHRNGGVHVLP